MHSVKNSDTNNGRSIHVKVEEEEHGAKIPALMHVEVVVPANYPTSISNVQSTWHSFLSSDQPKWKWSGSSSDSVNNLEVSNVPHELRPSMQRLTVVSDTATTCSSKTTCMNQNIESIHALSCKENLRVHCFVLHEEEPAMEELEPTHDGDDFCPACENLTLPHKTLDGLWENLIFSSDTKASLLHYAQSALLFSDMGISNHVVHWNRLILLHGPPGTGKTSLCRALAHKLAIRLSHRFEATHLLEIQSHSLFSKWFSTSGKLVNRLFELVRDMVQDYPNVLVCVLLDEVESLASSRSQLGGDPADSMRAVNSLLTSLDRLKVFPNVLIMSTTNMTNKVDAAFCDRADLKLFVGNPIKEARQQILRSCLMELQRVGLIQDANTEFHLDQVAAASDGLSGRSLRRLPLQAHALYLFHEPTPIKVDKFITALLNTLEDIKLNPEL